MSTLEDLRSLLSGVKGGDDSFTAKCPAHDDHRNSLSVSRGDDGRVLLKCFANCTYEQIRDALSLTDADLAPSNGHNGREIETTYPYTGADGSLFHEVVRFRPKGFSQRRPDPDRRGEWLWDLKGVERVLFHLPQLLKAIEAGADVFVVEGEKDVLALEKMGLVATTNSGGAGQKWLQSYTDILAKAKRVIIIPDSDQPGRAHAEKIRAELPHAVILALPDLNEHGDVSDWIARGGTTDGLLRLVTEAVEGKKKLKFRELGDLLRQPRKPTDWLVDGLLPKAGISLLYSKPKVGKSTLARVAALAVARGDRFLDRAVTAGAVLYLALEEIEEEVTAHFRDQGATGSEPIKVFAAMAPGDCLAELRAVVEQEHPALVIIDPLFRFTRIKDGNDYALATAALEPLVDLARKTGSHVMLVHHAKKNEGGTDGDGILGSTALFGSVDTAICLRKAQDGTRLISTVQRYGSGMAEMTLIFHTDTRGITLGGTRADMENERMRGEMLAFLQEQTEPVTEKAISEAVEGGRQLKCKALRDLLHSGAVTRDGQGGRGGPYRYSFIGLSVQGVLKNLETDKINPLTNPCVETPHSPTSIKVTDDCGLLVPGSNAGSQGTTPDEGPRTDKTDLQEVNETWEL